MQAVGMLFMNPTGAPPKAGSQMNSNMKAAGSGFDQMLRSILGSSISPTKGLGWIDEQQGLLEKLKELLQSMESGLLGNGQSALEEALRQVEPQELRSSLLDCSKSLEELMTLLYEVGQSLQSFTMRENSILEMNFQEPVLIGPSIENLKESVALVKQMGEFLKLLRSIAQNPQFLTSKPEVMQIIKEVTVDLKTGVQELEQVLKGLKVLGDQHQALGSSNKKDAAFEPFKEGQHQQEIQPKPNGGGTTQDTTGRVAAKLEDINGKLNLSLDKIREFLGKSTASPIAQELSGEQSVESEPVPVAMYARHNLGHNEAAALKNATSSAPVADTFRVFRSIMEAISAKAKFVQTPQQSEVTVQLKPESLGTLQMKVIMENGLITAKFAAETQQVKEILESNLNSLRQNLADQGIKVDQLEVSLSSQKEFHNFEGRSSHMRQSGTKGRVSVAEVPEVQAEASLRSGYFFEETTIDYTV